MTVFSFQKKSEINYFFRMLTRHISSLQKCCYWKIKDNFIQSVKRSKIKKWTAGWWILSGIKGSRSTRTERTPDLFFSPVVFIVNITNRNEIEFFAFFNASHLFIDELNLKFFRILQVYRTIFLRKSRILTQTPPDPRTFLLNLISTTPTIPTPKPWKLSTPHTTTVFFVRS